MPDKRRKLEELIASFHRGDLAEALRQHPHLTNLVTRDKKGRFFNVPRSSAKQRVYGSSRFEATIKALFIDWNIRDPEFCEVAQFQNRMVDAGNMFCAYCSDGDLIPAKCPGSCRPREGALDGCTVSHCCPCHQPAPLERISDWLAWREQLLRRNIVLQKQSQGTLTPYQQTIYNILFGVADA